MTLGVVTHKNPVGDCPKCGGFGLAMRVEPHKWGATKHYACNCTAGDLHRELVKTLPDD